MTNPPEQTSPGRWRALALLAVTLVLSMTTWFSASAVIPQLRVEWDLSATAAAWLTIAVQLGLCVARWSGPPQPFRHHSTETRDPGRNPWCCRGERAGRARRRSQRRNRIALRDRFFSGRRVPPGAQVDGHMVWKRSRSRTRNPGRRDSPGTSDAAPHQRARRPRLARGDLYDVRSDPGRRLDYSVSGKGGTVSVLESDFDPTQAWRVFANRGVRLASFGYFGHMWELFAMYAWFLLFFSEALRVRGVGGLGCCLCDIRGHCGRSTGLLDRWHPGRSLGENQNDRAHDGYIRELLRADRAALRLAHLAAAPGRPGVGLTVVADSAQFSAMVTELADQSYVGTALTVQLAVVLSSPSRRSG